jgi:hypothetical protein
MDHTPEPQYRSWDEIVSHAASQASSQIDERVAVRLAHIFAAFEYANGATHPTDQDNQKE